MRMSRFAPYPVGPSARLRPARRPCSSPSAPLVTLPHAHIRFRRLRSERPQLSPRPPSPAACTHPVSVRNRRSDPFPSCPLPVISASHIVIPASHIVMPASHIVISASHIVMPASHIVISASHIVIPASHIVIPGLVPGISRHRFRRTAAWIPGSSPGMTKGAAKTGATPAFARTAGIATLGRPCAGGR